VRGAATGARSDTLRDVHKVKATDLVTLRKELTERDGETLAKVRARMPSDLRAVFDGAVASSWIPDPELVAIYGHFCAVLFPGALAPFTHLGRRVGRQSYTGVYRVFLAIPSTTFVIGRAAAMWATYHSTGKATVEEITSHSADYVVRGADPIRREMIDYITGHVLAIAELTRAQDARVAAKLDEPGVLRWVIRWK
jgi:hypothetical protein